MSGAVALAPTAPRPRGRLSQAVIATLAYAILAVLAYWPVGPLDAHHIVGCACSDPIQEMWFLNWTSFALQHALNPFFTGYMLLPHGANLGANTFMPLLGLLGMPVTVTLGPIATFNLLLRVAFVLSGLSMFLVLRRYASWYLAGLGGLLFAFSPFMVVHGQRHLFLVFLPLLPPVIPLIDDWLVRPRRSPVRSGVLLGLLAGLEYLISPEIVLATCLMALFALTFLAARNRKDVASRIRPFATGTLAGLAVMAIFAGYPIWMLLAGPQHPTGPPHPLANLDYFHEDLLSAVIPTHTQLIAPHAVVNAVAIPPLGFESGLYVGLPLLALIVYLTVRCRRDGLVAMAAVLGGIAAILSLGSELQVGGHEVLGVMPFRVLVAIPILQNLEPARLTLFVQLAAAVILARGLDEVASKGWVTDRAGQVGRNRARTLTVAIVGAVALVPLIPAFPYQSASVAVPALFTTRSLDVIPQGAKVLTFPFDYPPNDDAMSWQVASGMRFRIFGGYALVPLRPGVQNFQTKPPGSNLAQSVLLAAASSTVPPANSRTVNAVRDAFRIAAPQVVLVDMDSPNAQAVAVIFERALDTVPLVDGRVEMWTDVGADLRRR